MTLDPEQIQEIRLRGQCYQKQTRRLQLAFLILIFLAFGLLAWREHQISRPGPQAYYFDTSDPQWVQVNDPSSGREIKSIHTFSHDSLWYTYGEGCWCLARYSYDADTFYYDYSDDFIEKNNAFEVVLVNPNETAWAAGPTSLMHFSEDEWTLISDDLAYQDPAALASSGPNSVIILNKQGTLTHIINGEAHPLALPSDFSGQPSIVGFDGTVWLAGEGLWRLAQDTQNTWKKIDPKIGQADTHFRIWNVTEAGVWLSTDAGEVGVYDPADNNFYRSHTLTPPIRGVSGDEIPEYIATDNAMYFVNNGDWQSIALPATGPVRSLAYTWDFASLTTDGLRSDFFSSPEGRYITSLLAFVTVLSLLAVFVYWIRVQMQRRVRNHKYLMSLVPDIPDYGPEAADMQALRSVIKWYRFVVFFGLIISIIVVGILLDVDHNTNAFISLAIGLVYLVWPFVKFVSQTQRNTGQDQYAYTRRAGQLNRLVLACVAVITLLSMLVMPNILMPLVHEEATATALAMVLGVGAGVLLLWLLLITPLLGSIQALWRGDYELALGKLDELSRYTVYMNRLSLQGSILQLAGRWSEAKDMWMETLTEIQHQAPRFQSIILHNLSSTLEALSRYDEAERYCRGALEIAPEHDVPYVLAALLAIRNQTHPDIVLQLYTAIPKSDSQPWLNHLLQRHTWALKQAQKALIADYIGQHDEATRLMKTAFDKADKTFKPGMAALYVVQGTQLMNRQQVDEAYSAFVHALELDPQGAAGQLARKALSEAGFLASALPV